MSILSSTGTELSVAYLVAGAIEAANQRNIKDVLKNIHNMLEGMPGVHKLGPGEAVNVHKSYIEIGKPGGLFVNLTIQGPTIGRALWANYDQIDLTDDGDVYKLVRQSKNKGLSNRTGNRDFNDIYRIPNNLFKDFCDVADE